MGAKIPWKSLSKQDTLSSLRGTFSSFSSLQEALATKRGMFIAVAGLVVVLGLLWRVGDFFGGTAETPQAPVTTATPSPSPAATPPAATPPPAPTVAAPAPSPTTPPAPQPAAPEVQPQTPAPETATAPDQSGAPVDQADVPSQGAILVSKRPVEVLSAPSATASAMYGFPAGRPFRVIGREGSFTHIQDVESGAKGWIDEAALALPPRGPGEAASSPSRPGTGTRVTGSGDAKSRATRKSGQASAESEPAPEPAPTRKRGLFGGGGPFRGLFGGGN